MQSGGTTTTSTTIIPTTSTIIGTTGPVVTTTSSVTTTMHPSGCSLPNGTIDGPNKKGKYELLCNDGYELEDASITIIKCKKGNMIPPNTCIQTVTTTTMVVTTGTGTGGTLTTTSTTTMEETTQQTGCKQQFKIIEYSRGKCNFLKLKFLARQNKN